MSEPNLDLVRLDPADLPAAYGILAIAGEHMHRVQNMSHWHPFPGVDHYRRRVQGRVVYGVTRRDVLVASFDLGEAPESYHDLDQWPDGDVPAVYFGGFAVLPAEWGLGVGRWAVAAAERQAITDGHRHFRFDAVSSNPRLLSWYRELGFTPTGTITGGFGSVTCFEKILD